CASCHTVQNAAGNLVGGKLGPELTRVGSKVQPEWLQAWLRNPRIYDPPTGMPHYRFNDEQVVTLAGFLEAKTDSDLLANVHLDPATPEQIAHGKRLVTDYGCASCHEIGGIKKPENFAPEQIGRAECRAEERYERGERGRIDMTDKQIERKRQV